MIVIWSAVRRADAFKTPFVGQANSGARSGSGQALCIPFVHTAPIHSINHTKAMHTPHFDMDEVSDAAMHLFWQKGYTATSIQELIDATGLSRSSIYNSFESKHGIFLHALRRYHQQTAKLVALLAEDGLARERVLAMLRIIVEDASGSGCLVANTALELGGRDQEVAALLSEHFAVLEDALTSLMERGQRQGEIDAAKSPQALARFFVATIQGLRVVARAGGVCPQQTHRLDDVVDIAMSAL